MADATRRSWPSGLPLAGRHPPVELVQPTPHKSGNTPWVKQAMCRAISIALRPDDARCRKMMHSLHAGPLRPQAGSHLKTMLHERSSSTSSSSTSSSSSRSSSMQNLEAVASKLTELWPIWFRSKKGRYGQTDRFHRYIVVRLMVSQSFEQLLLFY